MIHIDTSPEDEEFRLWCWYYANRHVAHSCSKWEAMEMFEAELPSICLEKIAANEQSEHFQSILAQLRKRKSNPSTLDFPRAKAYPILRLAEELSHSGIRFHKTQCPAHPDKTPSLHIYEADNRFHCFACGKDGDPIDLMELFTGCTNIDAVKRLS